MKVRIGNDICLRVSLLGKNYNDYVNIKSIRAYLINTSRKHDLKDLLEGEERTVRYVSRFPEEPHCRAFRSTPYDLCHSGHPTFHVKPICFRAYYTGFEVLPHSFDPFHNHLWAYGHPHWHNDELHPCHECECGIPVNEELDHIDIPDPNKFRAPVKAGSEKNKVYVYFPAEDQHHTGTYKLVIVAKIYEPGYAPNDLRTVTMDYKEVFTIVGSSEQADAYESVNIEVGNLTNASDINVTGTFAVGVAQQGRLNAVVSPAEADEYGVTWEVLSDGLDYIAKNSESDHTLVFSGKQLPEGVEAAPVSIKVTSKKTPSITKTVVVTVTREGYIDKYTYETSKSSEMVNGERRDYIDLHIAGGGVTKIDTTNETVWYEGD